MPCCPHATGTDWKTKTMDTGRGRERDHIIRKVKTATARKTGEENTPTDMGSCTGAIERKVNRQKEGERERERNRVTDRKSHRKTEGEKQKGRERGGGWAGLSSISHAEPRVEQKPSGFFSNEKQPRPPPHPTPLLEGVRGPPAALHHLWPLKRKMESTNAVPRLPPCPARERPYRPSEIARRAALI